MGIKTVCIICLALISSSVPARELHSYALVQDDASLLVDGSRVRLHGIYLPDSGRRCRTQIRPARCASRAALALDFRIQGFVRCFPQARNTDRSLNAICYVGRSQFDDGEDLAAYLLKLGWAVALPGAPYEYAALERIARHNGLGVWGTRVDRITSP